MVNKASFYNEDKEICPLGFTVICTTFAISTIEFYITLAGRP